jgi:hypothetical protein
MSMTTIRTLLVCAGTLVLIAACGGSGNGDVTIATDDPPPGSKSTGMRSGPLAADTTTARVAALPASDGASTLDAGTLTSTVATPAR